MAPFHKRLADPSPELTIGLSEYALAFDALAIRPKSLIGAAVDEVLGEAPARVQVRTGFRIMAEASVLLNGSRLRLDGISFDLGDVVGPFLEGASSVALFAATTGAGFDAWTEEASAAAPPYRAALSALGRLIAQRAADWAELRITEAARFAGCRITSRYYPGSCGWGMAEREKLFRLMPPSFCSIQVAPNGDAAPRCSVLGLIGIGTRVRKRPYPCEGCTLDGCLKSMGWAA